MLLWKMFYVVVLLFLSLSHLTQCQEFKFLVNSEEQGFKQLGFHNVRHVRRNDNVKISCQTNDPKANVSLTIKNNLGDRLVQTGQNFTILNIQILDNGLYVCKAFNGTTTITLKIGSFLIRAGPCRSVPVIEKNIRSHYEKTDRFTLSCKAPSDRRKDYYLSWMKIHEDGTFTSITPSKKEKFVENRATLEKITLIIPSVVKKDEGVYSCVRRVNDCDRSTWTSTNYTLRIGEFRFLVNSEEQGFKQLGFHNVKRVRREDNVKISCQTNDPKANVSLTTKNNLGDRLLQIGQNFTILNIQISDNGLYVCKAFNGTTNITLEIGSFLFLSGPCRWDPVIEKNIRSHYEKTDRFTLSCKAPTDGGKDYYLSWFKIHEDGTSSSITPSKKEKLVEKKTSLEKITLIIPSVVKKDEGVYSCVRRVNDCDRSTWTSTSYTLRMEDPFEPQFISITPNILKQKFYSNMTVTCSVKRASPKPDIMWQLNGRQVKKCLSTDRCTYRLDKYKPDRNYSCVANNSEGREVEPLIYHVLPEIQRVGYVNNSANDVSCQVEPGLPPKTDVYWQKKKGCSSDQKCPWINVPKKDMKIYYTKGGVLVNQIKVDEENEQFSYQCVAKNAAGVTNALLKMKLSQAESGLTTDSIIAICCSFGLLILLFGLVLFMYRTYLIKTYAPHMAPNPKFKLDPDRTLFEQSIELPYDPEWEFPRQRLDFDRVIGSGAFGEVWIANARGIKALNPNDKSLSASRRRSRLRINKKIPSIVMNCLCKDELLDEKMIVAVKTLKNNSTDLEYKDLSSEIKILIHLGSHPNIVNILGACTKGGNLCAITEYCPHDSLMHFLRNRRSVFSFEWKRNYDSLDEEFCLIDAADAAWQIAKGMEFLSEQKMVHRDLATRNVLVGQDYVMKIADFGLARDVYETDEYIKETVGMLPVKWMAPESLFEKKYTVKSDVWSFGIVLWEICTMGGSPYPGIKMEDIFLYIQSGKRMEQPNTCPNELYEIMCLCWEKDPVRRPFFTELVSQLERIVQQKTVMEPNLAAFERLRSVTSESDYLVPTGPARTKKHSLDTLQLQRSPLKSSMARKNSLDGIKGFPPFDDLAKRRNSKPVALQLSESLTSLDASIRLTNNNEPVAYQNASSIEEQYSNLVTPT